MTTTMFQLENMEVEVDPITAIQVDGSCTTQPESISSAMGAAFGRLDSFLKKNKVQPSGPPRVIYPSHDSQEMRFTVAFPVASDAVIREQDGVRVGPIEGGRALRFVHHGPYSALRNTYQRIEDWLREKGGIKSASDWARYSPMWEEYLNDPQSTPEDQLVTRIYLPLR
jgi:effector-binding domain-containing protein